MTPEDIAKEFRQFLLFAVSIGALVYGLLSVGGV